MDRIIALYSDAERANRARTHLFSDGFATDRLDVVSWAEPGRAGEGPNDRTEDDLVAHFSVLLDDERDTSLVERIVDALREGKAALVVHPRGKVEIQRAQELLEQHEPETVFWRVAPLESQGGILGERAAGPLA
ncbi:MAG: hypothetical protein ABW136_10940 [Steroidobacteraceae bacterium]